MQDTGLNRNCIDKYYTKPSTVVLCLDLVKKHTIIEEDSYIMEPSAGNGAFIQGIKEMSQWVIFYDISPEHPEVIAQDFLSCHIPDKPTHIIGNPPFGRQSSTAIKFIKHAAGFATSISFILPKSFKKNSMQRAFPPLFHLIDEIDIPNGSFLIGDKCVDVPCIFQIWKKSVIPRAVIDKIDSIGFVFTKKDDATISVRRVGVNAGKISINTDVSASSHYFIKFTNGLAITDNINKLSAIKYATDNTVGPRSISKQELIEKFNLHL